MKSLVIVVAVWICLILSGCESNNEAEVPIKKIEEVPKNQQKTQASQKTEPPKSLRELKKGEFISSKMLPLSELNPETNEDIYVHLVGRVVNINKQETWAVIQDGDTYFFAFGHAGITMMKRDLLGKEVYIRAIVELSPLTDNLIDLVQKGGMAPGKVPESINQDYRLNTTKIAHVEAVDKAVFMGLNK